MTTKEDASRITSRLLELKRDLEADEQMSGDAIKPVALDQQSVGRLSRMDALQIQSMAKATKARRNAQKLRLDAAFKRLNTGDYGYCVECGDEIAPKRLEFDPTVATCISCASG